jgi:tetratricopeptide (TPR) repeat protein
MKNKTVITFIFTCLALFSTAQKQDSLKAVLSQSKEDTNKVNTYSSLGWVYQWSYPDTAISYVMEGIKLARKLNFKRGEIKNLSLLREALAVKGNYSKALEIAFENLELAKSTNNPRSIGLTLTGIGIVYFYSGDYSSALKYFLNATRFVNRYGMPLMVFIG